MRRFFNFSHETASRAVKAQLPSQERLAAGLVRGLHDAMQFSRVDQRRSWLVAIDTHNKCYFGKYTPGVIGGPKEQGTKWFFGYATAVLLHKHRRYTVALCALSPGMKPHEIVRTLLDQIAGKGLKIGGAVLDSGFDSGETILLLQERELAYTILLRRKGKGSNARFGAPGLLRGQTRQRLLGGVAHREDPPTGANARAALEELVSDDGVRLPRLERRQSPGPALTNSLRQ